MGIGYSDAPPPPHTLPAPIKSTPVYAETTFPEYNSKQTCKKLNTAIPTELYILLSF